MFELKSGDRLGEWVVDARIGAGGLAEVWRSRPNAQGRCVALKVLLDVDRSEAHRGRFLREGRLLQRYPHGSLPRCLAVSEHPVPFLALELLQGETLADRLQRLGPLDPAQVEAVAASLLQVLDHLHQRGIVHRDVKPANIWLGEDRRTLLMDLGLAVDPNDPLTTTLGDVLGTYAYMAPEQIAGAGLDQRADLYSLGITLYEALSGTRPFYAKGVAGYLRAHREGRYTPIRQLCPEAPPRLTDLITRLMARDPPARPTSAPVARALLTGEAAGVGRLRQPPLRGRSAALGAVEAALDAGGLVTLVGEIGSGLGRVCAHVLHEARERGIESIALRCRSRAPALEPIEQLARDLRGILGPVEDNPEALSRALEGLAGEGGVLLLVEDCEECSPEAAAVLQHILAAVPRVALVCAGLQAPPGMRGHSVRLRPLNAEEVHAVVSGILGTQAPPAGLAERFHSMSGGLPAVIVLAVRELVERGSLWSEGLGDDGAPLWRMNRQAPVEPATGLRRLYGAALAALSPDARLLLGRLAVVGEPLPVDLAHRLAGIPEDGAASFELRRAGLADTEEHLDGAWVGLHRPAVGAMMLDEVDAAGRTAIHLRLALLLEALPAGPWRDGRRAWHAAHGAGPEDAPRALLALGLDFASRGRPGEALTVLDRAAQANGADPRLAAELAVARGEVLEAVGRRDEAVGALSAGAHLARDLGDEGLAVRALVATAAAWRGLGDEGQAARLAQDALDQLVDRPEDPALPAALLLCAESERLQGRPLRSGQLFERCVQISQARGDTRSGALARGGLGLLAFEEGGLERALRYLEEQASWLRVQGRANALIPTLVDIAAVWRCLGRVDRALEAIGEADDVARFANLPYLRALAGIGRAAVSLAVGDLEGATRILGRARVAIDPEGPAGARLAFREVQGQLRLARGDQQAALAAYQAAEAEAERAGHETRRAFFLGMTGVLTADGTALTSAMEVLGLAGERRLAARLLLHGALTGGDAEVLCSAESEARESGDRFLLLEVLHASGSQEALAEASRLADTLLPFVPADLRAAFLASPSVYWTGIAGRQRALDPGPVGR